MMKLRPAHANSRDRQESAPEFTGDAHGPGVAEIWRGQTRHPAEELLRQTEARFRALLEALTDYAYHVTVRDGRIAAILHGPGCLPVTGYSPEELAAEPDRWQRIVHPEDRAAVMERATQLAAGQRVAPLEHRIVRKNGETRWLRNLAILRHDSRGQYLGYDALVQDITAQRKLRDRMMQTQKMEALGQLAGPVAHDFRNQLALIKGYGELLQRRQLVKDGGMEPLLHLLKAADQSAKITGQLLAFSRRPTLHPEVVDVAALAADLLKSLPPALGEAIELSVLPCPGAWRIRVDTGQFQLALLNLVLNARDAMPHGGHLTIAAENRVLDEDFARAHAGAPAGRYVVVTIRDTGGGMSPETLSHLFEPCFTTKPLGQGTGLGLAMVQDFVAHSGGFHEVHSRLGQGTRFRLYFPAVDDRARTP